MEGFYEIGRERDENILYQEGEDRVCPSHFHRKLELMYVERGVKKIAACGKESELEADQIFFADSYALHGYLPSAGAAEIVVVIPNRLLQNYYDIFGGVVLKHNVIRDKEFCARIKPLFQNLKNTGQNRLLMQANVDMLLGSIVEYVGLVEDARLPERQSFVERVLEYIDRNYTEEINLDIMAEYFGYSKFYFSRIFNSVLGTSITDYISTIRLTKVLSKLRSERCSVSEAALDCGFSSIPTFYRALKKNYRYNKIDDLL